MWIFEWIYLVCVNSDTIQNEVSLKFIKLVTIGETILHLVTYGAEYKTAVIGISVCLIITRIICRGIYPLVYVYHFTEMGTSSFYIFLVTRNFVTESTGCCDFETFNLSSQEKFAKMILPLLL